MMRRFGVSDRAHREGVRKPLQKLYDGVLKYIDPTNLGRLTERWNKMISYSYLQANKERLGLTDKEIAGRVRRRGGSPNFMAKGDWYKLYNSLFLFSNANMRGWHQSWESAKENPANYAAKTFAYDVLPKIAMAAAAAGYLGDDLKRYFRKIGSYDLANYLIIPLGETKDGKAVYLRFPHDYTGQIVGAITWRILSDPKNLKEMTRTLDEQFPFSPANLHPVLESVGALHDYVRGINPMDDYYGRPMVREQVFKEGGWPAHKEFAKELWNTLGGRVLINFSGNTHAEVQTELETLFGKPADESPEMKKLIEHFVATTEMPVWGNILQTFLKVSDRGISEEAYKIRREEEKASSKRSNERTRAIESFLREKPTGHWASVYYAMKRKGQWTGEKGDFKRRFETLRDRMHGTALERVASGARSKATKQKILDLEE